MGKRKFIQVSRLSYTITVIFIALLLVMIWSARRRREVHLVVHAQPGVQALLPSIVNLTQGSLEEGNRVELVQNGDQFFPRLMQDIANAKQTVNVESYIWWEGPVCDQLAALLAQKARQGVQVRLLVDSSGGHKMSGEVEETLKDSGVKLAKFHPPRISNIARMNNRDHRKIQVIDGRIGYVGGFGIAKEWTGHGQDKDHWRDTGIRVEGPLVGKLQAAFSENWIEETGEIPAGPTIFPPLQPAGPTSAHVAYTSPTGSATSVQILHYLALSAAQRKITIQNPYLLPDHDTVDVLSKAVKRGVDVRIMVPSADATDSPIVQHASHHRYGVLLKNGVKIYEYQRTLLHQKVVTVDDVWSAVGSTNFDARSFQLNDEVSVGVVDPNIAAGLEQAFADDMKDAKQETLKEWEGRSLWHKMLDGLAYVAHEQL